MEENKKEDVEKEGSEKESKKSSKGSSNWPILVVIILVIVVAGGLYAINNTDKVLSWFGASQLQSVDQVDATDTKQWSYALGATVGKQLQNVVDQASQTAEVDVSVMLQAIGDVLNEKENLPMTDEQIQELLQQQEQLAQEKADQMAADNVAEGEKFMEDYKQQEGVNETEGGTLYKELESGNGQIVGENTALVTYTGRLIDGTEFDSSTEEPVPFASSQVIPGMGEALEMMQVGDTWEIVIPGGEAYGEQGVPGVIEPNETLIFEITVTEIQ